MNNQPGRVSARKNNTAASTLPEVGKIKIGEKVSNAAGVEHPKSLDYFRPTGNFANKFTEVYGDKPTILDVVFISDDLQEVCNERFECWTQGKRWGWGDGTTFTIYDTTKKDYIHNVPADDPRVKALKWDLMLTLRMILLKMKGIMGYWTFTTKAKATTIPSIVKAFDFVRERAGTIVGFPFNLIVQKRTGYLPETPRNYPTVSLVPNFSQESIEMVSQYLEHGGQVQKLTTAMIQQQKVLQIESGKQDEGGKKL